MSDRDDYNKIYDNGVFHLEAAEILAEKSLFGFAISHIVLGIEELIKYQVFLNHQADNNLFKAEIESIFRRHDKKHELIKEFQASLTQEFRQTFLESVFKISTGQELDEKHLAISQNRFKETGSFISSSYPEMNLTEESLNNFFQWLEEVQSDHLKNNGFYVDFHDGNWQFPTSFTEEDYKRSCKYGSLLKQLTDVVKSMDITDDEFMQMLNSDFKQTK